MRPAALLYCLGPAIWSALCSVYCFRGASNACDKTSFVCGDGMMCLWPKHVMSMAACVAAALPAALSFAGRWRPSGSWYGSPTRRHSACPTGGGGASRWNVWSAPISSFMPMVPADRHGVGGSAPGRRQAGTLWASMHWQTRLFS